MASETVDPIDWSHPPLYTWQYPLSSTYCTLQCGLGCESQDLLHWESLDRVTFRMPDQRTACAATQGIISTANMQDPLTVLIEGLLYLSTMQQGNWLWLCIIIRANYMKIIIIRSILGSTALSTKASWAPQRFIGPNWWNRALVSHHPWRRTSFCARRYGPCPLLKYYTHGYTGNHSTMAGICIAVSCVWSTGFTNESLVLLKETIRYSSWLLHIVKVR